MNKRPPICPTCKNQHPITKDGYEYLDCMLYIKQRDGKVKHLLKYGIRKRRSGLKRINTYCNSFNHNHSYPVLPHNLQYKMDMVDRVGCCKS